MHNNYAIKRSTVLEKFLLRGLVPKKKKGGEEKTSSTESHINHRQAKPSTSLPTILIIDLLLRMHLQTQKASPKQNQLSHGMVTRPLLSTLLSFSLHSSSLAFDPVRL